MKPQAPSAGPDASRRTSRRRKGRWSWPRRLLFGALSLSLVCIAVIAYANITAVWASRGRTFNEIKEVPRTEVGLVLGTTDRVNGRENLYFRYRIDAAVDLWKARKIQTLLVSGDHRSHHHYNEPEKMRRALVERGIPNNRIVCDYSGLRTLDSVVRAKEIFGLDSLLVISQRFQNERAIYIARANGIDALGFNARDVHSRAGLRTKFREIGARVLMWLDVNFLGTRPRHLGDLEALPE